MAVICEMKHWFDGGHSFLLFLLAKIHVLAHLTLTWKSILLCDLLYQMRSWLWVT